MSTSSAREKTEKNNGFPHFLKKKSTPDWKQG